MGMGDHQEVERERGCGGVTEREAVFAKVNLSVVRGALMVLYIFFSWCSVSFFVIFFIFFQFVMLLGTKGEKKKELTVRKEKEIENLHITKTSTK